MARWGVIIWRGLGFLVALFTFVSSLAMELATEAITGDDAYYQREGLPLAVALAIAGALSLGVGTALRRGGRVPLRQHSLFFIPMQLWGPILLALGVGAWVARELDVRF